VTAASSYASTVMADEPNAYWRLGETQGTTAVDSTANANNGSYKGGVTLNQPGAITGDLNGAVTFNGSTGFAVIPASASLNLTGALTLEAWVKFASTNGIQAIVNKGDGVSASGSAYELAWIPGTGLGFQTFIGGTRVDADQNITPATNQWYDLVGTRTSAGVLAFYVNGRLVATANDGGAALNNPAVNLGLGAAGNGSGQLPFNGTLDEVAVYPTALTATQVAAHWQAAGQMPGPPSNVTATGGQNQATVSWTAPSGSVTAYTITPSVGGTLRTATTVSGPATSATITGLSGGSTYSFTVVASNSLGSGPASSASNAVTVTGQTYPYAGTVLGDNPSAYWRLGESSGTSAVDATGHGNAAIYAGGYTQGQPGGPLGDPDPAVALNGSTGWVSTGNLPSLQVTGALTLEAWVKFTSTSAVQVIVNKGDGVSAGGSAYELAWIPGTGLGFQTFVGSTRYDADQNVTPAVGKWYYLVGTRSAGGQLAFYLNGKLTATGSDGGGSLNNVAAGVGLGASGNGALQLPLKGTLDEVAIYAGTLSAAQVSAHWQAGAPLPATPTNVQPTSTVNNQATVSWTPATSGGVAANFVVFPQVGSTLRTPQSFPGSANSAVVTGLSGGVTYTFTVVSSNSVGNSPPSAASNAVTVTGTSYPYSGTILGDGAAAYWRLGEAFGTSATDASGSGNAGTYTGGFTQGQPGGVLGDPDPACALDGATGFVAVPNAPALRQTGALTLEAWVKFASTSGIQIIVNKGDGQTASGSAYEIAWIPGTGLGFQTFIGNSRSDADLNFTPTIGQWYDLVGTRSATGQLSFYVNGSLVATGNDSGAALNDVAAGVGLGASGDGAGRLPVNGTLDEVAIYPVALSGTQVSGHYHAAGY
jgi:Concanavalin A-like lectin/glucanases superfamily/Fibronectin type III domain